MPGKIRTSQTWVLNILITSLIYLYTKIKQVRNKSSYASMLEELHFHVKNCMMNICSGTRVTRVYDDAMDDAVTVLIELQGWWRAETVTRSLGRRVSTETH